MPASPPPTTAIRAVIPAPDQRLRASTSPFSQPRSDSRPRSTTSGSAAIRSQQPAVLAGHREHARGAAAVEQRHEREPAVEPLERALRLERDHQLDRAFDPPVGDLAAEALEVLARQVDAAGRDVLGEVAQDVAELEREAEVVGERRAGRAVGAVEDAEREPADRARDAAAVVLELGEGRVLGAAHVHLGAVDELAERAERDRVAARRVGDGDEHGIVALVDRGRARSRVRSSRASFSSAGRSPSAMSSIRRASA